MNSVTRSYEHPGGVNSGSYDSTKTDPDTMRSDENVIVSVSECTRQIKEHLEVRFERVAVIGEITNLTKHTSGHYYFSLKDSSSQLACVLFRGNTFNLFFRPQNGMQVVCRGNISVYEPRGTYQLIVSVMTPHGEGALQNAFEQLKRKLFDEGLFDEARKKTLPLFPRKIALITSPSGAVLQDILHVKNRKDPSVEILIVPVPVQGAGAADKIARAVEICNNAPDVDVVIIARGGGSLEDLWAFNEEIVARAMYKSRLPIVSGIGHEVDFTIADFVADRRAPTPSIAADIVIPSRESIYDVLISTLNKQEKLLLLQLRDDLKDLKSFMQHKSFMKIETLLNAKDQKIDDAFYQISSNIDYRIEKMFSNVNFMQRLLETNSVKHVLKKGYVIVSKRGNIIDTTQDLTYRDTVDLTFHDGTATALIGDLKNE
jgi:exodeoxyribonuclease VII large subunit